MFNRLCVSVSFQTSNNEDYRRYYERMLEFAADDPNAISRGLFKSAVPRVLKGNYVQVAPASSYDVAKSDHCELAVVQERLFHDTLAVHLQKGSPYTQMFNQVLVSICFYLLLIYCRSRCGGLPHR